MNHSIMKTALIASLLLAPGLWAESPAEDVATATRAYQDGQEAPILDRNGYKILPYGHSQPVLSTAPLRVSMVEFQTGEIILSTVSGDTARWILDQAPSGRDGRTPVLVVKPTACDITTNLIVTTDRRIYDILLDSPACGDMDRGETTQNPKLPYTRRIAFYYPDELVRTWTDEARMAETRREREEKATIPMSGAPRIEDLNFDYSWKRRRSIRRPWAPQQVFDDGVHTYIRFSKKARNHEAPLLFLLHPDGSTEILNYAIQGDYYITDRVLERAVLMVGSGKKKHRKLVLVNDAYGE